MASRLWRRPERQKSQRSTDFVSEVFGAEVSGASAGPPLLPGRQRHSSQSWRGCAGDSGSVIWAASEMSQLCPLASPFPLRRKLSDGPSSLARRGNRAALPGAGHLCPSSYPSSASVAWRAALNSAQNLAMQGNVAEHRFPGHKVEAGLPKTPQESAFSRCLKATISGGLLFFWLRAKPASRLHMQNRPWDVVTGQGRKGDASPVSSGFLCLSKQNCFSSKCVI